MSKKTDTQAASDTPIVMHDCDSCDGNGCSGDYFIGRCWSTFERAKHWEQGSTVVYRVRSRETGGWRYSLSAYWKVDFQPVADAEYLLIERA